MMTGLLNCHAFGLHSIVLFANEGRLRRMFFTTKAHDLHRNWNYINPSIAFHPNRHDITLIPLTQNVTNVVLLTTEANHIGPGVNLWRYNSELIDGTGGFVFEREVKLKNMSISRQELTRPCKMKAKEVHSIYVPEYEEAAWIVEEGEPDPTYESIAYSNANLAEWTSNGLYLPMDTDEIFESVKKFMI